jgi:hypothetical protein
LAACCPHKQLGETTVASDVGRTQGEVLLRWPNRYQESGVSETGVIAKNVNLGFMEEKRYPIRKLMIKAAVFASKSSLSPQVRELLAYSEIVELGRCLDYYPSEEEAMRFLQAHAPSIVFVDFESVESALALIAVIERTNPGTQIIALHRVGYDSDVLVKAMRAGVREVLAFPLSESTLADSLMRVAEILKLRPLSILSTDNLYCFLPAKPGLGASTLAVNASANLARISGQKTLLMDLDLNNGISSFLLRLENSNSIADALDHASELDGSLWTNLITTKGNLDILARERYAREKSGRNSCCRFSAMSSDVTALCVWTFPAAWSRLPWIFCWMQNRFFWYARRIFWVCAWLELKLKCFAI